MKINVFLLSLLLLTSCSDSARPTLVIDSCAVDIPAANSEIATNKSIAVGGWAYDKDTGTVPDKVRIQITSENRSIIKIFDAKRGTKRPDVAKAFNLPAAEFSGYDLLIPGNALVPGAYRIEIIQDSSNALLICSKIQPFKIK